MGASLIHVFRDWVLIPLSAFYTLDNLVILDIEFSGKEKKKNRSQKTFINALFLEQLIGINGLAGDFLWANGTLLFKYQGRRFLATRHVHIIKKIKRKPWISHQQQHHHQQPQHLVLFSVATSLNKNRTKFSVDKPSQFLFFKIWFAATTNNLSGQSQDKFTDLLHNCFSKIVLRVTPI